MATTTFKINLASTTNASVYTTAAFTPAASDLLVAFVMASGSTINANFVTSTGITFKQIARIAGRASADSLYVFVANKLATAVSMTGSFDCTGVTASGALIDIYAVTGMSRFSGYAVKQFASQANATLATTPAPVFSASALTGNVTLGAIGNATSPATLTPPTSWTEGSDHGYATPTTGLESVFRNSGFTGTTVTWGSTSATSFASLIIELDTTTFTAPTVALNAPLDTATVTSLTPQLTFTGTDAEAQDIQYEVQIDTVNTFNSVSGQPLIDKTS